MSDIAIRVENLGKQYRIGALQKRHDTLRDVIASKFRRETGDGRRIKVAGLPSPIPGPSDSIWALRDVSFEVKRGEVVGVIGRNGAGKSTLLKILSRITEPSEGQADLHGRVASLLEVGTGFHGELSGRENIYLSGAIMGMRKAEIDRKFDEIVAFAEVEKFVDTPVKHYSSGMYVRLAFAVAAHLEPEILLVDEVLAVGDAAFQKKCLGKMGDVAREGRTVLFVSHNMAAIQQLCTECKLLEDGKILAEGTPAIVVQDYLALFSPDSQFTFLTPQSSECSINVRVLGEDGKPTRLWRYNEKIIVEVNIVSQVEIHRPSVDVAFYSGKTRLFALQSNAMEREPNVIKGNCTISFVIENPGFTSPEMHFDVGLKQGKGSYFLLAREAGRLSPDYTTIPAAALNDCLLFPKVTYIWKNGR